MQPASQEEEIYADDISRCTDELVATNPETQQFAHLKNIITQVVHFSKYLHRYTLHFLVSSAQVIDSKNYEHNLLYGRGRDPEMTRELAGKDNEALLQFKAERERAQVVTKLANYHKDFVYIMEGPVIFYLRSLDTTNQIRQKMVLEKNDFIDPSMPLEKFKYKRQKSINQLIRCMVVEHVVIQAFENVRPKFFVIPHLVFSQYYQNKNYNSVLSKEQINQVFANLSTDDGSLFMSKNLHSLGHYLRFEILKPGDVIMAEGQPLPARAFAFIRGTVCMYKRSEGETEHNQPDKRGNLVTTLSFDESNTSDSALFFGLECLLFQQPVPMTLVAQTSCFSLSIAPRDLLNNIRAELVPSIRRRHNRFLNQVNQMWVYRPVIDQSSTVKEAKQHKHFQITSKQVNHVQ